MRTALAVAAAVAWLTPTAARAETFPHTDLAGLVMTTDTIVVADRLPTTPGLGKGRYRIAKVLRGSAKIGDVVEVSDSLFLHTNVVDPRSVLYLRSGGLAALDTTSKGKVFCFREGGRSGTIEMVPRGDDPEDNWRAGTAQLDLAGLEREVGEAIARVDALAAARKLTDEKSRRAAVLALFPRARMGTAQGHYLDHFGARGVADLVAAGDFDGAVLVTERLLPEHRRIRAPFVQLIAIATDRKRRLAVRVAATAAMGGIAISEADHHHQAVLALLADPEPAVRAAAVAASERVHGMHSSDRDQQDRIVAMQAASRGAIAARFASEQDPGVLFEILRAFRRHGLAPPVRTGGVAVAAKVTSTDHHLLDVEAHCVLPALVHKVIRAELTLTDAAGKTTSATGAISVYCGGNIDNFATKGPPPALGRYGVELLLSGKSLLPPIKLGTLVVEADGSRVE